MSTLLLAGLAKVYPGGVRAVDRVDLEVKDGEFVVIVGPSGCGKSTLLRMVAGLEEATEGELSIDGRRVTHLPARDRDVAMVFQSYALYPHLDVRRNLAFGLMHRRRHRGVAALLRAVASPAARSARRAELAAIRDRVHRAASTLGLDALLDRRPAQLSGGQRQRVALGRALVREPKVFLFDEPLSNLDAKLRHEMRAELRLLHRRLRATMFYVTHDQEEAMSLGDRIVIMRDGRVQQIGPPIELYRAPANRFVAAFVGTPSMNFVAGTLERRGGRLRFEAASQVIVCGADRASTLPEGARVAAHLGVRPEHVRWGQWGQPPVSAAEVEGSPHVPARVLAVELLGDRADVVVESALGRWTVRVDADRVPVEGAETTIAPDPGALHFFGAGGEGDRL